MKRILCVLLSVLLMASTFAIVVNAVGESETNDLSALPEKAEGTNRYFFYMPSYWAEANPDSDDAYIYWWEGTDACGFPGYKGNSTGVDGIFYYDVPVDVTTILWNNGIYQTTDDATAYRSFNYNTEYYEEDESRFYPDGVDNFDGMIYVIDPSKPSGYGLAEAFFGELFYYYGNGEYGLTPDKTEARFVLTSETVDLDALYEKLTSAPDATADEATKDEATLDEPTNPTDPTEPTEPEEEPVFPSEPKPYGTNRYYFYLPDQWVNEYAYTAGIYWWEGSIGGEYWPGNMANSAGVDGVYYYDVATDTPTIIWNNLVDGGTDSSADIYTKALQTIDIPVSGGNYDSMIFVVDLSQEFINSYNGKVTYGGEWFYYYGSGQYGTAPTKAEADEIFTDKSMGEWATPDEAPTEPVVTEPSEIPTEPVVTEPSEIPTEPVVTEPSEVPTEPAVTEPSEIPTEPAVTEPSSTAPASDDEEPTTAPVNKVSYLAGDADGNGKVNVKDVTAIQKFIAKIIDLDTENAKLAANVNLDADINIKDATAIQKYLAKIELDIVIGEVIEKVI